MRITGLNLATGSIPMPTGMPGGMPDTPAPAGNQGPDVLVLLAAVLIIAGLVVTFVLPRRKAALAAIGACALAAALIAFTVLVRIRGAVNEQMAQSGAAGTPPAGADSEFGRQMQQQVEQMTQAISVDPAIGFWLTLIALIAAIVLNKMVHGRTDT
jgi:lysylphosphatidylglycerol synthetase-like protein (DUF2156 family)